MKFSKIARIVVSVATSCVVIVGLHVLLNRAPEVAVADSGDLFVSPGGDGVCLQDDPCDLQTALAAAAGGESIYMATGTYTGTGAAVITVTRSVAILGG
jgi:hypothetical protein